MNSNDKCLIETCLEKSKGFYQGRPYCPAHYEKQMYDDFIKLYVEWKEDTQPDYPLKALIARVVAEFFKYNQSYLSKARIRDRGYQFQKIDESNFTFLIDRHPGAFKNGYVTDIKTQKWLVDIKTRTATLLDNE